MFDLTSLVTTAGYAGLFAIIFAESGLLIGFFLPGDSLIFTAGFLASQGILNIALLTPLLFAAAVIGDSVGYAIGYRLGPKLFKREDSFFFHKQNIVKAQQFFEEHGKKTIILARFLPVVRTFAPMIAGIGRMKYSTFFVYNIIGGLMWAVGLSLLGYFLGSTIPHVDKYLLPIIAAIILLSFVPTILHIVRDKDARQRLLSKLSAKR